MNWKYLRKAPWLDSRALYIARTPVGGTLLDIGSSDGETLRHISELRPDLHLFATDISGRPDACPEGCRFARADIEKETLPWEDGSMDTITCMQVVEHLHDPGSLFREVSRLLKPGGLLFIETPHPKTTSLTSLSGRSTGTFTMNFYDDPTHTRPVSTGRLAHYCRDRGMDICASGTSRNYLIAAAHLLYAFRRPSYRKFTAKAHWLGWSSYLTATMPGGPCTVYPESSL